ncbi:unnamed protein product [Dicrocoelium dendriticum]|nr:unnamed protein product [Dicrocoelium dendriticum]
MQRVRAGGLGCELRSDLGSVRSYQASELEAIPLMQQVMSAQNGNFDIVRSGISNSCSPQHLPRSRECDYSSLLRNQNQVSSNLVVGMEMLSNRMMADAYLAAARAASAAVAASVISGSTDTYAPSTQITNDLAPSPVHETSERDKQSLDTSQQSSVPAETASTSSGHMEHMTNGLKPGRRGSNQLIGATNVKTGFGRPYEERHSAQLLIPSNTRGSRSSMQVGSPWGSVSGSSLTSHASLEAAARAAAAAAVASVMQHMSTSFVMHHAASSNNLNVHPYFPTRPASRAASVAGPPGKAGMESGDGESLHSAAFGPRYTPNVCSTTGELTPTSSLSPLDPSILMTSGTHQLTVPVIQRQSPLHRAFGPMQHIDSQFGSRHAIGNKPPGHHMLSRIEQTGAHKPQVYGAGSREGVTQRTVPNRVQLPHGRQAGFMYSQPVTIFHPTQQGLLPIHTQYTGIMPGFSYSSNQTYHQPQPHYLQQQTSFQPSSTGNETTLPSISSPSRSDTPTTQSDVTTRPQSTDTQSRDREPLNHVMSQNLTLNGPRPSTQEYVHNPAPIVHEENLVHREVGVGGYRSGDVNKTPSNLEHGAATPKFGRKLSTKRSPNESDEQDTLERRLHPGICCRDNLTTAETNSLLTNHDNEQSVQPNEEPPTTPKNIPTHSLRKSPVGASLHAIGNDCKLSDDEQQQQQPFKTEHPILPVVKCESRQVSHKKQPRLGVHSPRRANKPYEERTYNSHEGDRSPPTLKSSQLEYAVQASTECNNTSTHLLLATLPNGNGCP